MAASEQSLFPFDKLHKSQISLTNNANNTNNDMFRGAIWNKFPECTFENFEFTPQ